MRHPLFALVFFLSMLLACSDDDPVAPLPTGDPPETLARAERLREDAEGVHYRGLLVNPAQDVVAVEWRLEAVPASQSGVALRKAAEWNRAEGTEFEFVVPPATVEVDHWVLFVRAVTDRGVADESPMELSFGPDSVAPTVRVVEPGPFGSSTCVSTNEIIDLSWSVDDPDSTAGPLVTRYVVLKVGDAEGPCLTQLDYQAQQPIAQLAPDDERWSEWIVYDDDADVWDPSRSARLDDLALHESYLIALQARDATGATTSTFAWSTNVLHLRVSGTKSPLLTVTGEGIGTKSFLGLGDQTVSYSTLDKASISFAWEGDASGYAGRVVDYRWGWDLSDPGDAFDPGWSGPWSTATSSDARTLDPGPHNFVVQCRDNSGAITRGVYQLEVLAVPPRSEQRDLLLVDDWPDLGGTAEAREVLWDQQWEDWLTTIASGFDPSLDVIDAQSEPDALSLERLLQYKGILWFTNGSELSYLHNVYVSAFVDSPVRNDLHFVQQYSANVLLVGPGAGYGSIPRHRDFPVWFLDGPSPYFEPVFDPSDEGNEWLWPAAGFCARTLDLVRPPLGGIYGEEPGTLMRTRPCDGLARASVPPAFDAAVGTHSVLELRPNADRREQVPGYYFETEEFYDHNASDLAMEVVPRDCSVPMFVLHSRFAEGLVEEDFCGTKLNSLDGAAVGLMSRAYSHQKPVPDTHDFLWGFNPLGFEAEDVEAALRWVVQSDWQIR